MGSRHVDVLIVGGGVAGLAMARELSRRGRDTVLLERDQCGRHASGAAAGILAARGVVRSEVAGRMFYTRSLAMYPEWVKCLEAESGLPIQMERGEDFCLFHPGSRADRFRERLEREADPSLWREVAELPPDLGESLSGRDWRVFRFGGEGWLTPGTLVQALVEAARVAGAAIHERQSPLEIEDLRGRWRVNSPAGVFEAEVLAIAAGPWTGHILSELGWHASTVPVRGQVALLPWSLPRRCMVHLDDTYYLVPRGEATVVGATVEHGRWEEITTEDGMADLQARLSEVLPGLDLARAALRWAGLRPRTRDRVPHLGWLEPGRLLVASGHYRSGISMAPLTGVAVADLLEGRLDPDLVDLDPLRPVSGHRRVPPPETAFARSGD